MTSSDGELKFFSWVDYVVFGAMLAVSFFIGIYHGFKSCYKRSPNLQSQSESGEFLTANGKLGTIPVALSMLASFLSSITLMGQPAEVYQFGPQLWLFGISSILSIPVIGYYFIPFFHKLNVASAYKYFGDRFNRKFQLLASLLFTIQMILFLALVLYAPALALYQVTGLNKDVILVAMYAVVIFYTTVGGMKAVVWSDCFQVVMLFLSMFAVLIKGTADIGGFGVVWSRNADAGRVQLFNWNMDPTERYTVWSTVIGASFLHTAVYGANQLQVQRYLTVSTVRQAINMLWINVVGWTVIVMLTVYAGLLIFAKYYDCDPLKNNMIAKPDQLFPLYVIQVLGDYKGFPGLFIAGIFSAGLSTVSTGLNSLAAIWFSELDGTNFKTSLSEKNAGLLVKFLSFLFGILSFALVFVVPYMGGLVPVAISLSSFFSGSLFGIFLLGMFVPASNTAGATAGLLAGVFLVGWLEIGANIAASQGLKVLNPLPTSIAGCSGNTTSILPTPRSQEAFVLYRISFLWYSLLSTLVTVIVGILVSLIANWWMGLKPNKSSVTSLITLPSMEPDKKKVNAKPTSECILNTYEECENLLLNDATKDTASLKDNSYRKMMSS